MKKTFFFDAGLPRSGSTLLSALLNQNSNIHAGVLSPVFELMYYTEKHLEISEQVKVYPKPDCNHKIVSSIIENYYSDTNTKYVIDKCRAWPAHIDMIEKYIEKNPKIICTVRDPLKILASFIDLIHKNPGKVSFIDRALIDKNISINDDSRCDLLMSQQGVVFNSINSVAKAFHDNNKEKILFIDYDKLVNDTEEVLSLIYDFLEIPHSDRISHSYTQLNTDIKENDEVYGLNSMHELKSNIQKSERDYKIILSQRIINKYKNLDFWNH